jgi:alkylated DNA repair dioxygenase AlkB
LDEKLVTSFMKLPLESDVHYYDSFLSQKTAHKLYEYLLKNQQVDTPHSMMVQGECLSYNFGKLTFIDEMLLQEDVFPEVQWGRITAWPKELMHLKREVENLASKEFQVGVCIFYPDGNSGVDYHSDPSAFGDTNCIPSLSLGEERQFSLQHIESQKEFHIDLKNGSLIIMGNKTQDLYKHALLPNPIYKNGRINITFRQYGFDCD